MFCIPEPSQFGYNFCWIHSNALVPFLYGGTPNCTQPIMCGLRNSKHKKMITPLSTRSSNTSPDSWCFLPSGYIPGSCSNHGSPESSAPFLQSCFLDSCSTACTGAQDYLSTACRTSGGSY